MFYFRRDVLEPITRHFLDRWIEISMIHVFLPLLYSFSLLTSSHLWHTVAAPLQWTWCRLSPRFLQLPAARSTATTSATLIQFHWRFTITPPTIPHQPAFHYRSRPTSVVPLCCPTLVIGTTIICLCHHGLPLSLLYSGGEISPLTPTIPPQTTLKSLMPTLSLPRCSCE